LKPGREPRTGRSRSISTKGTHKGVVTWH
jgi:hypothetical protein